MHGQHRPDGENPGFGSLTAVAHSVGLEENLRAITTGGDETQQEREQWDCANNVVAIGAAVIAAYSRNMYSNQKYRGAGYPGRGSRRLRNGQRPPPQLYDLLPCCPTPKSPPLSR
jgi:Arginine deiminase